MQRNSQPATQTAPACTPANPRHVLAHGLAKAIGSALPALLVIAMASCRGEAHARPQSQAGQAPALPAPEKRLIPTVNIAPASGWKQGARPTPARGRRGWS